jgi:hypothetical protein
VGCTRLQGTAGLLLLWNRRTTCNTRSRFVHDGRARVGPKRRSAMLPSRSLPRKRWSAVMSCCSRQLLSISNRGATGCPAVFGRETPSACARRVRMTVSRVDGVIGKARQRGIDGSESTAAVMPSMTLQCDFFRFGLCGAGMSVSIPDADENCACAPIASPRRVMRTVLCLRCSDRPFPFRVYFR